MITFIFLPDCIHEINRAITQVNNKRTKETCRDEPFKNLRKKKDFFFEIDRYARKQLSGKLRNYLDTSGVTLGSRNSKRFPGSVGLPSEFFVVYDLVHHTFLTNHL